MSRDENDKLQAGELPEDPTEEAQRLNNAPRLLTVRDLLSESRKRATSEEERRHCVTGVHEIDYRTGGIQPGFVWLIGGDTSVGKSSFLVQIADENLKRGKRVLIVSSEDSPSLYGDRLMQRRARVNARRLRDGKLTQDERGDVDKVVAKAERLPVYMDARGKRAQWVAEHVGKIIDEHAIDLVAFDYVQEFRSANRHGNRTQELEEVGSLLRMSVKRKGKAGILFSQITVGEGRVMPDKHSIRNCRDISNAAEAILLIWEPKENIVKDGQIQIVGGTKTIFVDKVKNGPRGHLVPLSWDDEAACFNCSRNGQSLSGNDDDFPEQTEFGV
jgi:replicative DNA helicase